MKRTILITTAVMAVACGGTGSEDADPWSADEANEAQRSADSDGDRLGAEGGDPNGTTRPGDGADRDSRPEDGLASCEIRPIDYDYGLCVCGDVSRGQISARRAATGINGALRTEASTSAGALTVAGLDGIPAGNVVVEQRLYSAGPVSLSDGLSVGTHAFVNGDVSGERVTIGGRLTQPAGAGVNAPSQDIGDVQAGPVDVAPPCDCDGVLDISALVDQHRQNNDNARISLDSDVVTNGGGHTVDLPGGVYYFEELNTGGGGLQFNISGDTEIFVDGDLVSAGFGIHNPDGANVQIYVEDNLLTHGWSVRGVDGSPGQGVVHVYVGGDEIDVSGCRFTGSLTAPNAIVVDTSNIHVTGKVMIGGVDSPDASVAVDYDSQLDVDDVCLGAGSGTGSEHCTSRECDPDVDSGGGGDDTTTSSECEVNSDCSDQEACRNGECIAIVD